ncbi:MAG TPA: hypothetical protein VNX25_03840 [Verrucomicrobiae bacterium]|nr:hypothetical protein [Verrucomicrobiae bacterium]
MNRPFLALFPALALAFLFLLASSAHAAPSYTMPYRIDRSTRFLFFHHNYYMEMKGPDGETRYYEILKTFADAGYTVISGIRPKDASVAEYAEKGAADVRKLLEAGVSPENITVAGHSKGGVITLRVSSLLQNPKVRFVVMAGCGIKGLESAYPDFRSLKGDFLSIYATSDKVASSCIQALSGAKGGATVKELPLEDAAGHQLFFRPVDTWVGPLSAWLKAR